MVGRKFIALFGLWLTDFYYVKALKHDTVLIKREWPLLFFNHSSLFSCALFTLCSLSIEGHAVAQLVKALRYKPEVRGFDS